MEKYNLNDYEYKALINILEAFGETPNDVDNLSSIAGPVYIYGNKLIDTPKRLAEGILDVNAYFETINDFAEKILDNCTSVEDAMELLAFSLMEMDIELTNNCKSIVEKYIV